MHDISHGDKNIKVRQSTPDQTKHDTNIHRLFFFDAFLFGKSLLLCLLTFFVLALLSTIGLTVATSAEALAFCSESGDFGGDFRMETRGGKITFGFCT